MRSILYEVNLVAEERGPRLSKLLLRRSKHCRRTFEITTNEMVLQVTHGKLTVDPPSTLTFTTWVP